MKIFNARNGLSNFFGKLKEGKDVHIGYLGGSITLAEGYRPQTLKWLQEQFPAAKISHTNAGIGGTGSTLGVCRIDKDILAHKPDLVFVEFSTNDCEHTKPEWCMSAMEGIVRKIWTDNPETDICFLYTINRQQRTALHDGLLYWTAETMEKIADHYGIPSINMGIEVVRLEKEGKLIFQVERDSQEEKDAREKGVNVFSYDHVHPTLDDGHGLYTKIISECLTELSGKCETAERSLEKSLGEAPWTKANLQPISKTDLSGEWETIDAEKEGLSCANIHRLNPLWKSETPGAKINFKFRGTGFGLFCIFGLNSGQFKVCIDEKTKENTPLFDKYGNRYRVHYTMIATGLEDKEHDVVLELDPEAPDRSVLSPDRPVDDPAKLEGLVAYVGGLLLIGEKV
jgi:hypothetical protein